MLEQLFRNRNIKNILKHIDHLEDEIIQEVWRICEIPAPTFLERQRAIYLERRLRETNFGDTYIDDEGNVICKRVVNDEKGILLVAHMDTVFPEETPIRVQRRGNVLAAPGIGDNGISLADFIFLAKLLEKPPVPLRKNIYLAATVGEEGLGDLNGMKHLMQHMANKIDTVFVVDADLSSVFDRAVGCRRYEVSCHADGGHSWYDFGKPNAIHILSELIARITQIEVPEKPKTTYNIGRIEGGTSINTIAGDAYFLLDLRSVDSKELTKLEERVFTIIDEHDYEIQTDLIGDRPAGYNSCNQNLVDMLLEIHDFLGTEDVKVEPSSTDGNISISMGIPTVTFGTAHKKNAHRRDEYILTDSVTSGLKLLLLAVMASQQLDFSGNSCTYI